MLRFITRTGPVVVVSFVTFFVLSIIVGILVFQLLTSISFINGCIVFFAEKNQKTRYDIGRRSRCLPRSRERCR